MNKPLLTSRRSLLALGASALAARALRGQDTVFVCPMDPDVRSNTAGVCPRCGMKLQEGVPDSVEFHLDLDVTPPAPKPGEKARIEIQIHDPWKDRPVKNYLLVHEKLFHLFVVSQDLSFFVHDHPVPHLDEGTFTYDITFPKPGLYRVLGDFYPDGATPQLIARSVIVPGTPPGPVTLSRDYSTKMSENLQVSLVTDPPQAYSTMDTKLYFKLDPADGIEPYLGAWAHMLAASDDLIDLIHTHPFIATGGPDIEFRVTFPRPQVYRTWVQFQRKGVVNTVYFDIPVQELK